MRVLLPIPNHDFDPTEAAVPWMTLRDRGIEVVVATPDGKPAAADPIVLDGRPFGLMRLVLRTGQSSREAYAKFHQEACGSPVSYETIDSGDFDALLLPGGHAPKMKPYLESTTLQRLTREFFDADKLVGAICHGVLVAARTLAGNGKSVLYGRRTTALTESMELFAWKRTRSKLGEYYRTYPETTVQAEVTEALADPSDFIIGPKPLFRDSKTKLKRGFVVEDNNYISARYPGDIHRFSDVFLGRLTSANRNLR